ncbi:MAG: type II secretion system protein N [Pseudomonadota bacterium]
MALSDVRERLLRVEPVVRLAVEIALVVAIALIVARMIWLSASPEAAVADYRERPLPTMQAGRLQRVDADLSLLVRTNPFEGASVVAAIVDDVPDTQLNLRLIGLRADTGPDAGTATIILPSNQQQKFTEREEILPGVTLSRVLSDRVILNRNGVDEVLRLNNRSGRLSVIGDESTPAEIKSVEVAPTTVRLDGPEVLMGAVTLSEARSNGRVLGYRLEARGSLDQMREVGFQPGDVLLSVDGVSVANQDFDELLDRFGASREALLEIDRNGNPVQIIVEFDG